MYFVGRHLGGAWARGGSAERFQAREASSAAGPDVFKTVTSMKITTRVLEYY